MQNCNCGVSSDNLMKTIEELERELEKMRAELDLAGRPIYPTKFVKI